MGYKQGPLNVLKGQMENKAVGLAHGDSMAMQVDSKGGEKFKKDELPKKDNVSSYTPPYADTQANVAEAQSRRVDSLKKVKELGEAKTASLYGNFSRMAGPGSGRHSSSSSISSEDATANPYGQGLPEVTQNQSGSYNYESPRFTNYLQGRQKELAEKNPNQFPSMTTFKKNTYKGFKSSSGFGE